MFLRAEEPGEGRVRIEAGQAQPVGRTVPADQCGGLHIADECVILDTPGHGHLQSNGIQDPWGSNGNQDPIPMVGSV
ncbi:hypothetical protein GCM10010214_61620 [Streptomyces abikoensis]|nr:hypothetical protein GCM10010214_61620 [Streptomyces abikoensis]